MIFQLLWGQKITINPIIVVLLLMLGGCNGTLKHAHGQAMLSSKLPVMHRMFLRCAETFYKFQKVGWNFKTVMEW